MKVKKAFTMAEAILVMTILGIIATIMITTLKPAEFKDKGLKVLADKVIGEIDTATTQILINNSADGTMVKLYANDNDPETSQYNSSAANTGKLYKKFLTATRKACNTNKCPCNDYANKFYLKDGACMGISVTANATLSTRFPGEEENANSNATQGALFFDINGEQEPNVVGKDQFLIPINNSGIVYSD